MARDRDEDRASSRRFHCRLLKLDSSFLDIYHHNFQVDYDESLEEIKSLRYQLPGCLEEVSSICVSTSTCIDSSIRSLLVFPHTLDDNAPSEIHTNELTNTTTSSAGPGTVTLTRQERPVIDTKRNQNLPSSSEVLTELQTDSSNKSSSPSV